MKLRFIRYRLRQILYEAPFWWGGLVALLVIIGIEVASHWGVDVPAPFLLLGLNIIFCANLGGLKT